MPFLAGQIIEASRLNNLQPKTYHAGITGTFNGAQTGQDVPGATVTFDTATDNATAKIDVVGDFRMDAAGTGLGSVRAFVDGVATTLFALFRQNPGANTDGATAAQTLTVGLGTAGTHTINLNGTLPAEMNLGAYTTLTVTVYEAV